MSKNVIYKLAKLRLEPKLKEDPNLSIFYNDILRLILSMFDQNTVEQI